MDRFQWLIALHITGAFLFFGGAVAATIFGLLAQRRERPSEVALFLSMSQKSVIAIMIGLPLSFILGLWLVHDQHYGYGQAWISASILLIVVSSVAGSMGGRREAATRAFAEQLAAQGDQPSAELRARMRDPRTLVLSYGSAVATLAILFLMLWKPGS